MDRRSWPFSHRRRAHELSTDCCSEQEGAGEARNGGERLEKMNEDRWPTDPTPLQPPNPLSSAKCLLSRDQDCIRFTGRRFCLAHNFSFAMEALEGGRTAPVQRLAAEELNCFRRDQIFKIYKRRAG